MANSLMQEDLERVIKREIENNIKFEIDKAVEEIKIDIEKNIRAHTGSICAKVLSCYSFHLNENRMIVEVNFKNIQN